MTHKLHSNKSLQNRIKLESHAFENRRCAKERNKELLLSQLYISISTQISASGGENGATALRYRNLSVQWVKLVIHELIRFPNHKIELQ